MGQAICVSAPEGPCQAVENACGACELEDEKSHLVGGEPIGATFDEAMVGMSNLERYLLHFSGTSNLSAVLWLLSLGVTSAASDEHGTTCLHAACRTGSVAVVKELLRHNPPLAAEDVAGWTPLHVAAFVGRSEIVAHLLQAGASTSCSNRKGQKPADLCTNGAVQDALLSSALPSAQPSTIGEACEESEPRKALYYTPRQPAVSKLKHKKRFQLAGAQMFGNDPGRSVAFLLASGTIEDSPVSIAKFLWSRPSEHRRQVCEFLCRGPKGPGGLAVGTLSAFVRQAGLRDTGVISSLVKVFQGIQLPHDLRHLDLLVSAVAETWWEENTCPPSSTQCMVTCRSVRAVQGAFCVDAGYFQCVCDHEQLELAGNSLRSNVKSVGALHQLMLSTVLFHSYVHSENAGSTRSLDFNVWKSLIFGNCSADISDCVLQATHRTIGTTFFPELRLDWQRLTAAATDDNLTASSADICDESNWARARPCMHGWAHVLGEDFVIGRSQAEKPKTHTSKRKVTQFDLFAKENLLAPVGFLWISILHDMLFFASSPRSCAPHAFVHLRHVLVSSVDDVAFTITLNGRPQSVNPDFSHDLGAACSHWTPRPSSAAGGENPVTVIFLLPDGNWQHMVLKSLRLQMASESELVAWIGHLNNIEFRQVAQKLLSGPQVARVHV